DSTKALYLAEAGLNRVLYEVNNGGPTAVNEALGEGTYSAAFTPGGVNSYGNIRSTGTVSGISRTVTVGVVLMPPDVKGAVTVRSDISTTGNITIDGRDHYLSGAPNGAPGIYGVSTGGQLYQGGNSDVGGNGVAPASPANPISYQENSPTPPTTPWGALGVTQAWYLANIPTASTAPTNNIGMVRYDPSDGTWNPANLGISVGIIIVHNDTNTATVKNVHGILIGMLIADNVEHINGDALIVGAVITTNQAGNTFGNGNALVAFSSGAIQYCGSILGNTTAWRKAVRAGTWRESP
ncbi:MAG TPA: hypothetical protein P5287_07330, partial [bacterium]|nr:hypothetical protein [bacterium]